MREINGYPNYRVNIWGEIYSVKRNIFLKSQKDKRGRVYVGLTSSNGDRKRVQVSRIVAQAFINNPLRLPCVNHIDGNPSNNDVDNLEWCTYQENSKHAVDTGLHKEPKGIANCSFKAPIMIEKDGVGKVYFGRKDFEMDGFENTGVYKAANDINKSHKGHNVVFLKMQEVG